MPASIVAVPKAEAFVVVPAETAAVSVKVSPSSAKTSSTMAVRTWMDESPARMVAEVASVHVAPTKTWMLSAPAVP